MMRFNRDRRENSLHPNGSSTDKEYTLLDRRSGIDRRSNNDRRLDYDEQRKSDRYKLRMNACVILKQLKLFNLLKPKTTKFSIVNISNGGLQAQYVGTDMHQYEENKLSIETDDGSIRIDEISFKVISDNIFTNLPDNSCLRRCGIRFIALSENQKKQISILINKGS
jgi:c-di-GMP-binding flagellar brake protein YcgR